MARLQVIPSPGDDPVRTERTVAALRELLRRELGADWPVEIAAGPPLTPTSLDAASPGQVDQILELLRSQTALLSDAQRIGRMGTWNRDLRSGRLEWSDATCELFGITPDQFQRTHEHFASFVIPEDTHVLVRSKAQALRGDAVLESEYRIRRPDGQIRWMYERGQVQVDSSGDPVRRLGVVMDVTERRQAEQEVRRALERWTTTIESITDAFFTLDRDWRFTYVNAEAERLIERSRVDLLGRRIWDEFKEAVGTAFHSEFHRAVEQGVAVEFQDYYPPFDRWFEAKAYPSPEGLAVYFRDVTGRLQVEAQLREQATLLDKAQDAILVRDLDHRIQYWNKGAERLYGWTEEEVVGRAVDEVLYHERTAFLDATRKTLEHGEWVGEIVQVTRDGRRIVAEGHWTRVDDKEGRPRALLSINTDITSRKHLEQQYLRAQRMESIGTLAGGIAHDLNNVLAPIMMSIELLRMSATDQETLEMLETIERSAQRGAALLRQVLSFGRGMGGTRVDVDVAPLVRDVVTFAAETFPKNIRIESRVADDIWRLHADPTQVHQVLLNLCLNARDAMPDGGAIIITAANFVVDEQYAAANIDAGVGRYVTIEVADTGAGIPAGIVGQIFDPFFTTKEVGRGTGLGLSTSLAIVKGHGGFLRVDSEPGAGARFHVALPAGSSEAAAVVDADQAHLPRGRGETVLVVDDEASIRQITKRTLEAFGYRVLLAADGAEAVSTFVAHQGEIALVLTDMLMPVMDGPATVRALRQTSASIPVIGASGFAAASKVAEATAAGVTRFLPKPYTAETLLRAVRDALAAAR